MRRPSCELVGPAWSLQRSAGWQGWLSLLHSSPLLSTPTSSGRDTGDAEHQRQEFHG